jgi:capsular polysaccharide biosynthesis protein
VTRSTPTRALRSAEDDVSASEAVLVSFHFVRSALRRRWRTWAALGLAGFVVGVSAVLFLPASSVATTTLLLAHDRSSDPATAMATDVSLIRTRTVAHEVIGRLDLSLAPEAFQESFRAEPTTSDILTVTVSAGDGKEALRRSQTLVNAFLAFRNQQIRSQSDALVAGNQRRIGELQRQSDRLTQMYAGLSAGTEAERREAADLLTRRGEIGSEIGKLEQAATDSQLQSQAITGASHVVDDPAVKPDGGLRPLVLAGFSGVIGGLALGMGLVLFRALTSDRLSRREEIALVMGAPVKVGTGRVRAPRWAPWRRRRSRQNQQVAVRAIGSALEHSVSSPQRLVVAALQNADDGGVLVAALASELAASSKVQVVDLGGRARVATLLPAGTPVDVVRPAGVPLLAAASFTTPATAGTEGGGGGPGVSPAADLVITFVELTPAGGLDELVTWGTILVPVVTADRSSAEYLRTCADIARQAGLVVAFIVVIGGDETDESNGTRLEPGRPAEGARRRSG